MKRPHPSMRIVATAVAGAAALACSGLSGKVDEERLVLEALCGPLDARAIHFDTEDYDGGGACFNLGLYWSKQTPEHGKDLALARKYFARACELGSADGCHNLAVLAERGENEGVQPGLWSGPGDSTLPTGGRYL